MLLRIFIIWFKSLSKSISKKTTNILSNQFSLNLFAFSNWIIIGHLKETVLKQIGKLKQTLSWILAFQFVPVLSLLKCSLFS